MNFLGTNNQETVIFKHSSNDQVKFLPQFVRRQSYGLWFNGTNEENYNGFRKLTDSDWSNAFVNDGITQIALEVLSVTINGVVVFTETDYEIFVATSNVDYEFGDEGYGFGFLSYINELNVFISSYGLQTHFYPATSNTIVGIINKSENFEVSLREVATLDPSTYTLQDNYSIKCEYGNVSDGINGYFIPWV